MVYVPSLCTLYLTNSSCALESPCLAPDQLTPVTEPQASTPQQPTPGTANPDPPISPLPEPDKDVLTSIHVTIQEIKDAQEVLQKKKWYYTDRHGKQVDVGERMRRILRSVEDCAKIVDIAIQHHPEISSLVWAGARFILMVGHISEDYLEWETAGPWPDD